MKNKSYTFASDHNPSQSNSTHAFLDRNIVSDHTISWDSKGCYAQIQAGAITLENIPLNIANELIRIGYLKEVE